MKRDFGLIRQILLAIEDQQTSEEPISQLSIEGDLPSFQYHLNLLIEARLVDAEILAQNAFTIRGLTWEGHDFLDAIRNKGVWQKVLTKLATVGGTVTFELVKELAKDQLRDLLKG